MKPLEWSTMIPSASWGIVFHYPGQSVARHVVSSSSCIPAVYLEPVLFLIPLQCVNLFCNLSQVYSAIPKQSGPEAKGSNPTTGLTLLWARNPFRRNFNHWQVSRKDAGQIFLRT